MLRIVVKKKSPFSENVTVFASNPIVLTTFDYKTNIYLPKKLRCVEFNIYYLLILRITE